MHNLINASSEEGMREEELLQLVGNSEWSAVEKFTYWTSEVYSFGKILRMYGWYPKNKPLYIMTDHGPSFKNFVSYELKHKAPVQFFHSPRLVNEWKKISNKPCFVMRSPFVFYRRKRRIYQSPNAKGTLVFPAHSTHGVHDLSDAEEYIQQLLLLPEAFQPVSICMYYLDIHKGRHKIFQKYGLPVYTAGNWTDLNFVDRFYGLLRNYKYSTSNLPGSYTYYSVEMGIPFFLYGGKPVLYNEKDPNFTIGQYDSFWQWPQVQEIVRLFSEPQTSISSNQKNVVEKELGLQNGVNRLKMCVLLYYAYLDYKFQLSDKRKYKLIKKVCRTAKFYINKLSV